MSQIIQDLCRYLQESGRVRNAVPVAVTIQEWTGPDLYLQGVICDYIKNGIPNLSSDSPDLSVSNFISTKFVQDWQNGILGPYLSKLEEKVLQDVDSKSMLLMYQSILEHKLDHKSFDRTSRSINVAYNKLVNIGLIVEKEQSVRVSNLLYASIFTVQWASVNLASVQDENTKTKKTNNDINQDSGALVSTSVSSRSRKLSFVSVLVVIGIIVASKLNTESSPDQKDPRPVSTTNPTPTAPVSETSEETYESQLKHVENAVTHATSGNYPLAIDRLCNLKSDVDASIFTGAKRNIEAWYEKEKRVGSSDLINSLKNAKGECEILEDDDIQELILNDNDLNAK